MDYFIKFIGHIIEEKRPPQNESPAVSQFVYRAENDQVLKDAINAEASRIIKQGGMVVLKNPDEIEESGAGFDKHIFIPMEMIAYIETETKMYRYPFPESSEGVILQ